MGGSAAASWAGQVDDGGLEDVLAAAWSETQIWDTSQRVATVAGVPNWKSRTAPEVKLRPIYGQRAGAAERVAARTFRYCSNAGTPSPVLLKHLLEWQEGGARVGGEKNDSTSISWSPLHSAAPSKSRGGPRT